mmetsp:Transcript_47223/g.137381  ORF Transcript_47223/g.137381 Transcript_47223/m.137381 type:complete len:383 (-) Transcript_47223:508-1656(-)
MPRPWRLRQGLPSWLPIGLPRPRPLAKASPPKPARMMGRSSSLLSEEAPISSSSSSKSADAGATAGSCAAVGGARAAGGGAGAGSSAFALPLAEPGAAGSPSCAAAGSEGLAAGEGGAVHAVGGLPTTAGPAAMEADAGAPLLLGGSWRLRCANCARMTFRTFVSTFAGNVASVTLSVSSVDIEPQRARGCTSTPPSSPLCALNKGEPVNAPRRAPVEDSMAAAAATWAAAAWAATAATSATCSGEPSIPARARALPMRRRSRCRARLSALAGLCLGAAPASSLSESASASASVAAAPSAPEPDAAAASPRLVLASACGTARSTSCSTRRAIWRSKSTQDFGDGCKRLAQRWGFIAFGAPPRRPAPPGRSALRKASVRTAGS